MLPKKGSECRVGSGSISQRCGSGSAPKCHRSRTLLAGLILFFVPVVCSCALYPLICFQRQVTRPSSTNHSRKQRKAGCRKSISSHALFTFFTFFQIFYRGPFFVRFFLIYFDETDAKQPKILEKCHFHKENLNPRVWT
jgi:hypothetical protein